jgi:hypothetical protein
MSDIPQAREILQDLLLSAGTHELSARVRREICKALRLMTRKKTKRRLTSKV